MKLNKSANRLNKQIAGCPNLYQAAPELWKILNLKLRKRLFAARFKELKTSAKIRVFIKQVDLILDNYKDKVSKIGNYPRKIPRMEDKTRIVRKRVKSKKRNFFSKEIANFKDELRRLRSLEIIIFAVIAIIFTIAIFHQVIYEYFAK